jgi:CobQ-like glutamine amidotransferase family enzyme
VSKTLKLATLFPEHLNLNGDHGNLLVLQKRLKWLGITAEIVPVTSSEDLVEFDFVLVGHGSNAAWAEVLRLDSSFVQNVVAYIESGKTAVVVSSGVDLISKELFGVQNGRIEHRSLFVKTEQGIVGYLNSDSNADELQWHRNSVLTLLHGPVLAKNPDLADELIQRMGIQIKVETKEFSDIRVLAEASRSIAFEN